MNSDEFMRRWEAMPDLKHAELIDGIVYLASPLGKDHSLFHLALSGWLDRYVEHTPACQGGIEDTWLMSKHDVPLPDLTLTILPRYGGQSRTEGQYSAGAPELILEVAVSSTSRDLGVKLRLYEQMGVREYLIAVAAEEKLIWNELTPSGYRTRKPGRDGMIRSRCFPGLWLDTEALWHLDRTSLSAVLREGIASPEHAAFVKRLARRQG